MYRFAAYHFLGAKRWGVGLTDIILASGDVSFKADALVTGSGRYAPEIIDFSERDGRKRLEEIRSEVDGGSSGTGRSWSSCRSAEKRPESAGAPWWRRCSVLK